MLESLHVADRFYSEYLGCDLSAVEVGKVTVAASRRRERREATFATVFALWALITQGRCVVSTQAALLGAVTRHLWGRGAQWLRRTGSCSELGQLVVKELGREDGFSVVSGPLFVCSPDGFRSHDMHPCRRVVGDDVVQLYTVGLDPSALARSIAEGTCYAAFSGDTPVALSGTHAIGHMSDQIGEICVETLNSFRRQGYGKTVVSQVTAALLERGQVPLYATSDWNEASARTARSVGYEPYGWQLWIQLQDSAVG